MRISDWSSDVCSSDLLVELWNILERRLQFRADLHGPILRWAMFAIARAEKGKRFPKDKVFGGLPAIDADTATPGEIEDFLIAEHARFNPRWLWGRIARTSVVTGKGV